MVNDGRHQGHGNHWRTVFEDVDLHWLPELVERGRLVDPAPAGPLADGRTIGIAWPEASLRGLALISGSRSGPPSNEIVSGYPWAEAGVPRRLVIREIMPWDGGFEAWIRASTPDDEGPELTFFDTRYYANKDRIGIGMEAEFRLAGLAYLAEVIDAKPVFITNPDVIKAMRAGRPDADSDDPIEVQTHGAAMLFPRTEYAPDEYEFQGPVKDVELFEIFERKITRLTVTVSRLFASNEEDLDIALYVGSHVWSSNARPSPGADCRGLMWLQGYLAAD